MGREIKRVPMDFDWPIGEVWPGFMCRSCMIGPPEGDGYQLWENITEGSPVSSVFATPEELADWLIAPGNDTSITQGTSREQWLAMIRGPGWAPSLVIDSKGCRTGVQA